MSETSTPRKRRLGRLEAKKKPVGIWLPTLSLCVVLGGLVVDGMVGAVPGLIVLAVGIALAWFGRDAKGRGIATIALVLGICLLVFFLAMMLIGRENIHSQPMY